METPSLEPRSSLSQLNHIHEQLDALFFEHQAAVLQGDLIKAKALLAGYEAALEHHMKEEEEILLPLYRDRATSIRGGHPDNFSGEHQKINEWLTRIKMRLYRIVPTVIDYHLVIALLDDEAGMKSFMEHHTLRENNIFYPELDRVVTAEEKQGLLRLLTFDLSVEP